MMMHCVLIDTYITLQRRKFAFLLWGNERKYWQNLIEIELKKNYIKGYERSKGNAKNSTYTSQNKRVELENICSPRLSAYRWRRFTLIDFVNILLKCRQYLRIYDWVIRRALTLQSQWHYKVTTYVKII